MTGPTTLGSRARAMLREKAGIDIHRISRKPVAPVPSPTPSGWPRPIGKSSTIFDVDAEFHRASTWPPSDPILSASPGPGGAVSASIIFASR